MTKDNRYIYPRNKKLKFNRYSKILATGVYFPDRIISNDDIIQANNLNVTDKVIQRTIGVKNRRAAEKGITDSDLLFRAAVKCLEQANIKPEELSKLIVTKFLGDRILPMTASMVQRKLGSNLAFHAIDIDGGINSFLQALNLSNIYISTSNKTDEYILILSGGLNRAAVSDVDPRIAFLFGDGAGAVLLKQSRNEHFLASYEFSNFNYFDFAGSRDLKFSTEVSDAIFEQGHYSLLEDIYTMKNWKELKDFYIESILHTKNALLDQAGMQIKDIDLVLFTENNKQMNELAKECLEISNDKTLSLIEQYGNTMSAMLPILIDYSFSNNIIREGMNVMLLSFGEGISGGGIIYRV